MQVTDFRLSSFNHFTIHFKDDTEHPVGAWMLWTHVEGHGILIALQQSLVSYTHESPYRVGGFDLTNSLLKSRLWEKATVSVVNG